MGIRSQISALLQGRLGRVYNSRLARGAVWSIPAMTWAALPGRVRSWLGYRIFEPADQCARSLLEQDTTLGCVTWPAPNPYSFSPISRIVLHGMLERARPRRIIELGSGVSTLISAAYAARSGLDRNGPAVCSIDHDAGWLEETRKILERAGLASSVRLIHAPLHEREIGGVRTVTYDIPTTILSEASGPDGFDLCLIDGPPVTIGREPCLPLVAPFLAPGATVLLDDGIRPEEQAVWKAWRRRFPSLVRSRYLLTDRGLFMGSWARAVSP